MISKDVNSIVNI